MSITASNFLDGQLIKGNLSIVPGDCVSDGLGQLEVLGGIYTNNINQFNTGNTVGVTIEGSNFYNGNLLTTGITTGNLNFNGDLYRNGILYENNTSQWSGTTGTLLYYGSTGSILVGIGTTNPNFTLDVNGSINFNNGLYENGIPYISSQWNGTNDDDVIYFGTSSNVFVGIGTSAPTSTLDVYGDVNINNTIVSNNSTTGGLVISGGISINNTRDALSFTSGGGLTISGGASIDKTLYSRIIISTDSTIQNLNTTNFTSTSAFINNLTIENGQFTNITSQTINVNLGLTAGSLYITGGSILNDITASTLLVTNVINSSNLVGQIATIQNVVSNNITTNSINASDLTILGSGPSYNSTTASLVLLNGGLSINVTENAINVSSGGGLTNAGGLSVAKDIYIGGTSSFFNTMNLNNNVITNVTSPNSPLDVVNKYYTDRRFDNLTQGQVVITDAPSVDGNNIKSFSSFTYDGTLLSVRSTDLASSISNGGTFMTYGGATIQGNLIVGLGIDANDHYITNVATPIYPGDGVNKQYVDDLFINVNCELCNTNCDLFENNKIIPPQTSMLLTELSYDGNLVKVFIAYVYISILDLNRGLYTIKGFYNGTTWIINTHSIGNYTNIGFSIVTDNLGVGTIICYNPLVLDVIYIKYRKYYELQLTDIDLLTVTLNNNVNTPTDIPGLKFVNEHTVGFKCAVIIKTPTKNAMFLLTGLNKNGIWVVSYTFFGDPDTLVSLSILSQPTYGQIQYTNTNTSGIVTVQAENIILLGDQANYTLFANTNVYTEIEDIRFNINKTSNFMLIVYIEVPSLGLYTIMEINSLVIHDDYSINTIYSGDNTNVTFRIIDGVLHYINTNGENAIMKYNLNLAPYTDPLCVVKGGTGASDLLEFSILRGNGRDSIIGTEDLIYQNKILTLGNISTIQLNNTEDVIGNNGGTIITNGGINVVKSVYIGGSLDIQTGSLLYKTGVLSLNNTMNATGLTDGTLVNYGGAAIQKDLYIGGDLFLGGDKINVEQTFLADNGVFIPEVMTNFVFNNSLIRYFTAMVSVCKTSSLNTISTGHDIKGIQTDNGWELSSSTIGNNTSVYFTIDQFGQMMYTSNSIGNWISTVIKFKMLTLNV